MSTQLAVQSQIALQTPAEVIQAAINDPAVLGIRHDARIPFHALWKYWEWKRRAERLAADRKEALRHERAMNTIVLGLARHYVRERQASRLPQPPPALATPPASPLAGSLTPASLSPTAVSSPFGTTTVSVSTTSSFSNGPDSQAVSKSAVQLEQPILGPIALPIAVQVTNIIAPATPHAPASPTRSSESSLILADEVAGATDSASLPLSVYLGARVLPQYPPRPTALPIYPRTLGTDDLEPIKVLGQGGFGTVYLARDRATDTKLAVKVISKERFAKYGSYEPVFAEQEVMRKMAGKKGFLPLHGSWHDEDSFYLATEYCANGDLNHAMHAWRKLPNEHARFWIAQLLLALDELHENNIILRDVKPENILFNRHGHVVLADFGLARHFASTSTGELRDGDADFLPPGLFEQDDPDVNYTRRACGTAGFMAPEILENKPYSFSVDFWAMGIIMYTMLVGKMPFTAADRNNRAALDAAVVNDPLRFESWDHVDPMARDFLSKVLSKNPSERPSVEEMKAHAFFESIDWERLAAHKLRAPWIPAAHTVFSPTIGLLIPSGAPYTPTDDPCPQFSFVSPKLLGAPPVLPETVDEPEAPAKKMRRGAFRRLFSRGVKETWLRGGDLHKIGDVVFRMEGAVVITPSPLAPLIVSETPTTDASSEYVSEKGVRRQFGARVKGWWRSMLAKAKKA